MPAVRRARHDVILRVPRAIIISDDAKEKGKDKAEGAGELLQGRAEAALTPARQEDRRRSMSPVKGARLGADGDAQSRDTLGSGNGNSSAQGDATAERRPQSTYKHAADATSAAEWNSLLIWARRQRGPQWDSATGMWQVDQDSTEYYSFGNDPARHTKLSTAIGHVAKPHDGYDDAHPSNERRGSTQHDREPTHLSMDSSHGAHAGHLASNDFASASALGGALPMSEDSPPIGAGARRSRAR